MSLSKSTLVKQTFLMHASFIRKLNSPRDDAVFVHPAQIIDHLGNRWNAVFRHLLPYLSGVEAEDRPSHHFERIVATIVQRCSLGIGMP